MPPAGGVKVGFLREKEEVVGKFLHRLKYMASLALPQKYRTKYHKNTEQNATKTPNRFFIRLNISNFAP